MKKAKTTKKAATQEEPKNQTEQKPASKFGVLGKDLSRQFSSRSEKTWQPSKRGGRNGQGKP